MQIEYIKFRQPRLGVRVQVAVGSLDDKGVKTVTQINNFPTAMCVCGGFLLKDVVWCGLHNFSIRGAGGKRKRKQGKLKGSMKCQPGHSSFYSLQRHLARLMNLFFLVSVEQLERSKMGFSCRIGATRMTTSFSSLVAKAHLSVCVYVWVNSRIAIIGKWMNNKIFFSFSAPPPPPTPRFAWTQSWSTNIIFMFSYWKFFFCCFSHAQLIWKINFIV